MKKRIIKILVNDEYIVGSGVVIGAAGSHHDVELRVTFSASWDGLYKYATFRDAKGENPTVVMITALMLVDGEERTYLVPVPAAAERYAGQCYVTFSGFTITADENGVAAMLDTATNTANAIFRILPSDYCFIEDEAVEVGEVVISAAELEALAKAAAENAGYAEEKAEAAEESAAAALTDREYIEELYGQKLPEWNENYNRVYNQWKAGDFKGEKGDTYELTEDDKSEIVQKISDESLADIEAALVYIISIQNKLLGVSEGLAFAAVEDGYEVAGIGECTDTDIVIPKMYEGALVVGIADAAFYHCDSITSVIIPDSVTSIGEKAFADCSALIAISIPDGIQSISTTAFEDCSQLIYKIFSNARYLGNDNSPYLVLVKAQSTSITSCRIGSSTKLIYQNAFNECKDLENISVSAVDERDYTWVAQKKGIITFSSNCDFITVTHNDKIYGYEGTINGYLSISVNKDEPVDIRLIKNEGVNEGDAELDMTFTDGSYGSNLAWDKGITLFAQKQCNSTINDDNIKFTATDSSPSIQMTFREGHNRGRYLAIKYKSDGFYNTQSYYFSAVDGDGRVINMSENSKFQHRTFVFTNDGAWHTLIIDTSEYMTGTSVNGQATHDGSQYAVTGLRLNFSNIAVDSEIFIKALELSDDKTFLQNKLAEV